MSSPDPTARAQWREEDDAAALWIARLRSEDCSDGDWDRFCAWRDSDERNGAAFDRCMDGWDALGDLAEEPEIVRLRLDALAEEPELPKRPAWLLPLAAGIAMTVATGLISVIAWQNADAGRSQAEPAIAAPRMAAADTQEPSAASEQERLAEERFTRSYRSAVGQRSKIDLPDGSSMELNTDTVIEVDYTPQRREFRLVRGEALFDVEPDASRPFIVNSDDDRVIALGTVFTVRKVGKEMVVSLIDGKVQVERLTDHQPGAKPLQAARLAPGQQLRTAGPAAYKVGTFDDVEALGWRTGRLVFEGDRLSDVVAELNRYSVRKLAVGDSELADLRVSGTFRTGSAEAFAAAISYALPVSITSERESGKIVLYAAEENQAPR